MVLKHLIYLKIHKIIAHESNWSRVEFAKPPLSWPTCTSKAGVTNETSTYGPQVE